MPACRFASLCLVAMTLLSSAAHAQSASAPSASAPASRPAFVPGSASVDLRVRVIVGKKKGEALDPRLSDLFGSLKNLAYNSYALKDERAITVVLGGQSKVQLPGALTLVVSPIDVKAKAGRDRVHVRFEIPELKFAAKAWIGAGGTLVVGGPKFEDGVLLFAVSNTRIAPNASGPGPGK